LNIKLQKKKTSVSTYSSVEKCCILLEHAPMFTVKLIEKKNSFEIMIQSFKRTSKFVKPKRINSCKKTKYMSSIYLYKSFRKAYYSLDDNERETLKRERRRLQEQLRRVKRNEARYNQYEKQQMLFEIQHQNLALIQSIPTNNSSATSSMNLQQSASILSNFQLSLSEDEEENSSSSL